MARPIHDVTDHLGTLTKSQRALAEQVSSIVKQHKLRRVTLWRKDYYAFMYQLKESGFDVARGYRLAGAKVECNEQ